MLKFTMTRNDKNDKKYSTLKVEYDAIKNMTIRDILGKSFTYSYKGIDFNISVTKVDCRHVNTCRYKSDGFGEYEWIADSLCKFGKIVSPDEQRKIKEQKLMSL